MSCGARAPKSTLTRLALSCGRVIVDAEARLPGRGAYVCARAECRAAANDARRLGRAFRRAVPPDQSLESLR